MTKYKIGDRVQLQRVMTSDERVKLGGIPDENKLVGTYGTVLEHRNYHANSLKVKMDSIANTWIFFEDQFVDDVSI